MCIPPPPHNHRAPAPPPARCGKPLRGFLIIGINGMEKIIGTEENIKIIIQRINYNLLGYQMDQQTHLVRGKRLNQLKRTFFLELFLAQYHWGSNDHNTNQ